METKRCPVRLEGCGKDLRLTKENWYTQRRWKKDGDASILWSSICRECTKKKERNRHRVKPASRVVKAKYDDMKADPIVNKFLYGAA